MSLATKEGHDATPRRVVQFSAQGSEGILLGLTVTVSRAYYVQVLYVLHGRQTINTCDRPNERYEDPA